MILKGKIFILVFIVILLSGCAPKANSVETKTELTISAASSMTESLLEIKKLFEKEFPSITIIYNFGGSGTLRKQIEQGAPSDLFFPASKKDFALLKNQGMIQKRKAILKNRLVIIVLKQAQLKSFKTVLEKNKKIAIGTPEAVPAGTYSEEALKNMGVWEQLQDQLVFTKDVQQVLTFVKNGAVDAGIVYVSDTVGSDQVVILEKINPKFHSSIEYYMSIINHDGENHDAKEKFFQFIQNKQSLEIFKHHGFDISSLRKTSTLGERVE